MIISEEINKCHCTQQPRSIHQECLGMCEGAGLRADSHRTQAAVLETEAGNVAVRS